jgi:arginine repressor
MDKQTREKVSELIDELSVHKPREDVMEALYKVLSMSPKKIEELAKGCRRIEEVQLPNQLN